MLNSYLSSIDYLIIFCSMLASVAAYGISYYYRTARLCTKTKQELLIEYLLMGRKLTMPFFILSLSTSWYGNILGVTQIAFEHGIYNFITQGIFWYLGYLLFVLFFVDKIRTYNAITLPHLVKAMFGSNSQVTTAILVWFKSLPLTYSISLAILFEFLFNVPFNHGLIMAVGIISLAVFIGGFRGTIIAETIQSLFLIIALFAVVVCSYLKFGGFTYLAAKLPQHYFNINGAHSIQLLITWFLIALSSTLLSPTFYQRCLAAKDNRTAKLGICWAIGIWVVIDILVTLGGMYAKAANLNVSPHLAYLNYGLQILPNGMRGIFIAGIFACVFSTLDARIMIATSAIFHDIRLPGKSLAWQRFYACAFCGLITILLALSFEGQLENAWLNIRGLFTSCLLLPILTSLLFNIKSCDKTFVIACVTSFIVFVLTKYLVHLPQISFATSLAVSLIIILVKHKSNWICRLNYHFKS